jgi:hypothetical protein
VRNLSKKKGEQRVTTRQSKVARNAKLNDGDQARVCCRDVGSAFGVHTEKADWVRMSRGERGRERDR